MNWMDEILFALMIISIITMLITGELTLVQAHAQEAVDGVNGAFGGVSKNLRDALDIFSIIDDFIKQASCVFMGLFTGFDNLPEDAVCR